MLWTQLRKVLRTKLGDIWMRDRDVCPEMHEHLEWPGQQEQEQWNSLKWRQQALQGNRVVANVYEAHEVASAALPVFAKVLNEVRQSFFLSVFQMSKIHSNQVGAHSVFVHNRMWRKDCVKV